jgi:hypothetical protein
MPNPTATDRPTKPSVPFALDGHDYDLTLTLGQIVRYEKASGDKLLKRWAAGDFSVEDAQALLWAALGDPELTLERVGDLVHLSDLGDAITALQDLLAASLPKAEPQPEPEAEPEGGPVPLAEAATAKTKAAG